MPASPWRPCGSPNPDDNFVAMLTYLPLKSYWRVLPFFLILRVVKQLTSAHGLVGYSFLARPLSKQFWTLSAWNNEQELQLFVQHPPHAQIMTAMAPYMGEARFVRWTVKGSELPLLWDDALRRFSA